MSERSALVLQAGESGPPGLLADWASARGIPLEVHRTDRGGPLPELDGQPFIAWLGSRHSPADSHVPAVVADRDLMARAVERAIPVLGLCYGGQLLATVLGGTVEAAPEPELGWHRIDSADPHTIPEGPWLQWHFHRFSLPPQAELLATTARALQAFRYGPHLGVQFHPESTPDIVKGWARADRERLTSLGVEDGEALVESGRTHASGAQRGAFQLFDAFWARAQNERRDQ